MPPRDPVAFNSEQAADISEPAGLKFHIAVNPRLEIKFYYPRQCFMGTTSVRGLKLRFITRSTCGRRFTGHAAGIVSLLAAVILFVN